MNKILYILIIGICITQAKCFADENPIIGHLLQSGVADHALYVGNDLYVGGASSLFSLDSKRIVYYSAFTSDRSRGFFSFGNARIKWIDPNGDVFHESKVGFQNAAWHERFIVGYLHVVDIKKEVVEGDWKVELSHKGEVFDTHSFKMMSSEYFVDRAINGTDTFDGMINQSSYDLETSLLLANKSAYTFKDKTINEMSVSTSNDEWLETPKGLKDLGVVAGDDDKPTIALLVYRSDLVPDANSESNRHLAIRKQIHASQNSVIRNIATSISKPKTISELYGYEVTLNTKNGRIGMGKIPRNLNYPEYVIDRAYPHDASLKIAERIGREFKKQGLSVIDLTPARYDFEQVPLKEIIRIANEIFKVDKLLVIPHSVYTRWLKHGYSSRKMTMSLRLSLDAYAYEIEGDKPTIIYAADIDALDSKDAWLQMNKVKFYSRDGDVLHNGIIDSNWLWAKVLDQLIGQELGEKIKTEVGGELFTELRKAGLYEPRHA